MERPFPANKGDESYVFVSYAHEDADIVYPEIQWLKDQGFNIWFDEAISPGSRWPEELATFLQGSALFLYFATPHSVNSLHCQDETNLALDLGKPTIAVHLQETELTPGLKLRLNSHQAILKHELTAKEYRDKIVVGLSEHVKKGMMGPQITPVPPVSGNSNKTMLIGFGVVAVAILAGAFLLYLKPAQEPAPAPTAPSSESVADTKSSAELEPDSLEREIAIAVLPFVNMSNDPDNEYFSDGVSEDILNALVQTNTLPVIARTSSFQFKGKNLNVQEIASKLNVTHLVEGSVRKVGHEVRITAQLVDAATGIHLWSERYDRELINIFVLQEEIAASIVKEIQARVGGRSVVREPSVLTRDIDPLAYDIYLKALQHLKFINPSRREAIGLFQQAVVLDPEFTGAWVGLGGAHMAAYFDGWAIPGKIAPLAKSALNRALDLDPDNASALSWLGYIRAVVDYEWVEGSALMERAVQLSPHDAGVHWLRAWLLYTTHQPGVMQAMERAYRLDPLSPDVVAVYALLLNNHGRQLDAKRLMEAMLLSDVELPVFNAFNTYFSTKNFDLAEQYLKKAKAVWGADHPEVLIGEFRLADARGNEILANSIEQALLQRMESEFVRFGGWGYPDSFKRRIQLAYQQRQPNLVFWIFGLLLPQFTDEEWQNLGKKMNIAELGHVPQSLRSRTKAEENNLLERRIELDSSVVDRYVGSYGIDTGEAIIRFSRRGKELWVSDPFLGYFGYPFELNTTQSRTIAVAKNEFELFDLKGYKYKFLEPGTRDYDLAYTNGQVVSYYRRVD